MNTRTQRALNDVFNTDPIPDEYHGKSEARQQYEMMKADGDILPLDDNQYAEEDNEIKQTIEDDYHSARYNLKDLLEQSKDLLYLAIQSAQATENPQNIDAATKLMGQIAAINGQIVDLTSKKQDVFLKTRPKVNSKFADALNGDPTAIQQVTNNTMFVGTTADLAKMIKDLQNKQDIVVENNTQTENKTDEATSN